MSFEIVKCQVRDYCDCLDDLNDMELEKLLNRVLFQISLLTGWSNELCDTLLNGYRRQVFHVKHVDMCSCCENDKILKYKLKYPFVKSTQIVSKVYYQSGLRDICIDVNPDDIFYSHLDDELRIDISNYITREECNKCKVDYKLLVEYCAGYDELPECVLPIICTIIQFIKNEQSCGGCGVCTSCLENEKLADGAVLSSKSVGEINYAWTKDTTTLDSKISDLLTNSFMQTLGTISIKTPTDRRLNTFFGYARGGHHHEN